MGKPFKVMVEIPYDDVESLLISACETGSGYWARNMAPAVNPKGWSFEKSCLIHGFRVRDITDASAEDFQKAKARLKAKEPDVHFSESDIWEEAGKLYYVSPRKIAKALELMSTFVTKRHFNALLSGDADAETGDVFLQLCVFGDVIYG